MNVVIIGAAEGIGREIAIKFLSKDYTVIGIDRSLPASREDDNYKHYICNIESYLDTLPDIDNVGIVVTVPQVHGEKDIDLNLKSIIRCVDKYVLHNDNIKSVVNLIDAAATTGADFDEYVASMGGLKS